jgi:predicted ATPase
VDDDVLGEISMSQTLVLNSLGIRNFRGLRELNIQRLGRANLITGRNNVGKTSVLEALRLYAEPGDSEVLLELLDARDELKANTARKTRDRRPVRIPIESLFFRRRMTLSGADIDKIRIGPLADLSRILTIGIELSSRNSRNSESEHLLEPAEEYRLSEMEDWLRIAFRMGGHSVLLPFLKGIPNLSWFKRPSGLRAEPIMPTIPVSFVSANGLNAVQIGNLWDGIALTDLEDEVNNSLRIIADIERLSLIAPDEYSRQRIVVAKVTGYESPVTLRSMGDGLNRLFGLVLAMVNARGGLFLIDEIENGLHYSIQPDVWRTIFRIAERLNIQVFATTHSSDCVKAFEIAARESPEEGVLIRLSQKGDQTLVGEFDEEELGIAVEGNIEVR